MIPTTSFLPAEIYAIITIKLTVRVDDDAGTERVVEKD